MLCLTFTALGPWAFLFDWRKLIQLKYYLLVGGKRDKHMVEHEHFNQQRAVQYYVE